MRRVAFQLGMALLFVRISLIHEVAADLFGFNSYVLYWLGIPTMMLLVVSGAIGRTLAWRPAILWSLFAVWLLISLPFSSYRGGSLETLGIYYRAEFPILFLTGGIVTNYKELRRMMLVVGGACVFNLLTARLFMREFGERQGMTFGTIANPNDLSVHLLLVLPFLIFPILQSRKKLLKLALLPLVAYGLVVIVQAGSRGAALATVVALCSMFFFGSSRLRVALMVIGPLALVLVIAVTSDSVLRRIGTLSAESAGNTFEEQEAIGSSMLRRYLLEKSLVAAATHPIFGIGVDQFPNWVGKERVAEGLVGGWNETHNVYTQIASEVGIPGFLLYLGGILTGFSLLLRVRRYTKDRPDWEPFFTASLCLLVSSCGYFFAITFFTLAYRFYPLALAGFSISLMRAFQNELQARRLAHPESVARNPGYVGNPLAKALEAIRRTRRESV